MVSRSVAGEIESAVSEVLRGRGVEGQVVLKGAALQLHHEGTVVEVDLGEWAEQWVVIPGSMRDRRATASAARLEDALRAVTKKPVAKRRTSKVDGPAAANVAAASPDETKWTFYVAGMLLVAGGAGTWWWFSQAPASAPDRTQDERRADAQRRERVCEAGRKQLHAGGSMGVDSTGWVVELWLGRAAGEPFVKEQVAKWVTEADPSRSLGRVPEGETRTRLQGRMAVVRFEGPYVAPFFNSSGRQLYLGLAARLTKAAGANNAALYAKCAHLDTHDSGAWFWGKDPRQAAVSLLYASGVHADPPVIQRAQLGDDPLATLYRRAGGFEPRALASAVTKAGGKLKTRQPEVDPDGLGGTAVRFGLTAPTRALRAARALVP